MRRKFSFLLTLALVLYSTNLFASPVDLSTFPIIDPTVSIGPNNSSATITEDLAYAPVGLWGPSLAIPNDAQSLIFNYMLNVPSGHEDYFDLYFGDLSGPSDSFGGFNGIHSGSISKDLTGFAAGTLALAFALNYGWNDQAYDSVLTISDVQISQISQVPEPATFLLVSAGLIGIAGIRNKFQRRRLN